MASHSTKVWIGSDLRVDLDDLDTGLAEQIRSFLTVPNEIKRAALERGDWGADEMVGEFELWSHDGRELVMPRGFAHTLRAGIEADGGRVEWADRTVAPSIPLRELVAMKQPRLHEDQEPAAQDLLRHRQGVLSVPTGGGKTVIGLETFRRAGVTGLVVVNNVGLADQWRARAMEHLGIETGLIGDGVWEERSLTIAMVQTLYSRRHELDREGFWARWGMTTYDEAHHAQAETYRELIARCASRYLFGKTATPLEGDWRQPILTALLGPIVHTTTDEQLRKAGRRVAPLVRVVKTPFHWVPKTKADQRLVDSRAIYRRVIEALVDDPNRMGIIVTTILDEPYECAQLVVCKRLEYLQRMQIRLIQAGYDRDRIFFYRGAESREERARVAEEANEGHCIILATVADEGVDIPRLDRLHLTWPQRKALTITQQAGRVLRQHPDKGETVIIDYADILQGVLRSQFYARVNDVYRKKGWPLDYVDRSAAR